MTRLKRGARGVRKRTREKCGQETWKSELIPDKYRLYRYKKYRYVFRTKEKEILLILSRGAPMAGYKGEVYAGRKE
jgi:hypothetical protein